MTDQEALALAVTKFGDRADKPELMGDGILRIRRGDNELSIQIGGERPSVVESLIGMMIDAYDATVRREAA